MTTPAQAPAFVFAPQSERLECAAFSGPFKAIAVVLVTMALLWAVQMWSSGLIALTLESSGWLAAALAMMLYTQWHILRGKTTLSATTLEQTWVWRKQVSLADLAYAKLIRVRGLEWLIAPRLYTKTFSNKLAVFYATSPTMLAELQRLEQALKQARAQAAL
jgi:hypothetical protein